MRIVWRDEFSIDGGAIDNDHQRLIGIINDFATTSGDDFDLVRAKELLASLKKYALEHFKREEHIMLTVFYIDYKTHRRQHRLISDDLEKIIADFRHMVEVGGYGYADVWDRTFSLLKRWLVNHVLNSDRRLKPYFTPGTGNDGEVEPPRRTESAM